MSKRTSQTAEKCPITFALDTFGDKWSLIILRDIIFKKKRYYGEFLSSPESISTNILAARLSKLEDEGLLSKKRDPQHKAKSIYSLTQKGKDLLPLLLEMIEWSTKYDPQPNVPDHIIEGAPANLLARKRAEPEALINEILSNLEN